MQISFDHNKKKINDIFKTVLPIALILFVKKHLLADLYEYC